MHSYTVAQVLAAEDAALAAQGQLPLMRRAATAVALAAVRALGTPLRGRRVVLLVGGGNNGGDALFAGANLARRGLRVDAVCTDVDRAHAAALDAFRRAGGRVATTDDAPALLGHADLIVDGLVGIGARPPLRPPAARLVELANAANAARLAVDLPSGLDPDDGTTDGPVLAADHTVTFGGAKTGLLVGDHAGVVEVQPLDFPLAGAPFDALILDDADAAALLPRSGVANSKYSNGVVGIAAGSTQYPGAAVMCAGGAVRLRPGMVRFAGGSHHAVVTRWPEVVATATVAEAGRVQAWVVGPGLGGDDTGRAVLAEVLAADVPVLVDADGLRLLAERPELLARRTHPTVLTPHAGEFSALFPDLDPARRLHAARTAAARSGAFVLLKGHHTVVAAPDGRTAITLSGSGWLASAGSGDVLSGVTGSLLAAGLDPFTAAALGAFVHGRAGEKAEAAGHAGAQALWEHLR
ncbi:NAD(P)H-hydrate dehydratase [Nakamurella deserti]|uniref:NAD(P)H-hydrate dehydratase n=1 Tax=Nakamurella deserti TaxID=2164074 RepID=UPI000DBE3268|nr:NAD(P)H-hydrate dehydratase [Nakamurella deserti]